MYATGEQNYLKLTTFATEGNDFNTTLADLSRCNVTHTHSDLIPFEVSLANILFNTATIMIILMANGLVLIALYTERRKFAESKYVFVANLAVADFLFGIVMIYNFVTIFKYESLTYYTCLGLFCVIEFSLRLSNVSLLLISVDQFVCLKNPLKYHDGIPESWVKLLLVLVWFLLLFEACLPLMGWSPGPSSYHGCLFLEMFSRSYILTFDLMLFWLPGLAMVVMYSNIFSIALHHARLITAQEQLTPHFIQQQAKVKRETKTAVTITIVIATFAVSWIPLIFIRDMESIVPGTYRGHFLVPYTIAGCNSCYNPFIYALRDRKFRYAYRKVLCRRSRCGRNDIEVIRLNNVSSRNVLTTCA